MPKLKMFPPRPAKTFLIGSTAWNLDNVAKHTLAGFAHVADDMVRLHYFRYIDFLQSKRFLLGAKSQTLGPVDSALELWSHELTLEGYRFVQYSHDRWIGRVYQYADTVKETAYLEKWHRLYLELPAGTFADGYSEGMKGEGKGSCATILSYK